MMEQAKEERSGRIQSFWKVVPTISNIGLR